MFPTPITPTIQAAIVAGVDGDTVVVDPGTYNEAIDFSGKNLVVGSFYLTSGDTSYISTTIINGTDIQYPVSFVNGENQDACLIGFTIQNAGNTGIRCISGSSPTLSHLRVIGNYMGIRCETNCQATLEFLVISNNSRQGLYIKDNSSPTIRNVTVSNNQASGIICEKYSDPLIENVLISDNVAIAGAGIWISDHSNPLVKNSNIVNNRASNAAGVYLYYSSPRFENVLIANNTATATQYTNGGGGVGMFSSSPVFVNVTIVDNHANEYGGGVSASISHPVLINSIVWNNSSPGIPEICSFSYGTFKIAYSDIKGGAAGVQTLYNGTYTFLDNVIGADTIGHNPAFDLDYRLQPGSPCIDAGAAYYELEGNVLVNIPAGNYNGGAPDMGAFEKQATIAAAFSVSSGSSGVAPFSVNFIDQSTATNTTINSRMWYFGDGSNSAETNPTHVYENAGSYTVTLVVSDGVIMNEIIKTDYITVTPQVVASEIFVTEGGSDETGDGSASSPYQTIQKGIDMASAGDIVTVQDGTYSGAGNTWLNFGGKSIVLRSQNGAQNCIINADGANAFNFDAGESNDAVIRGFSIINAGYGIMCEGASPTIEYCIIRDGSSGICTSINWSNGVGSSPIIRFNQILNNSWEGIQVFELGNPQIINNTIVGNLTYGILTGFVDAIVVNNIIVGSETGIVKAAENDGSVISRYNCVWNNTTNYQGLAVGTGDISSDPLFVGTGDYHLQSNSPCIDAGDPQSLPDPDGTIVDIGALYFHHEPIALTAEFTADVTSGEAPLLVNFTDKSSGSPTYWQWEFGDGESAAIQNPQHKYETPGVYDVMLITGNATETDTINKTGYIEVLEKTVQQPQLDGFVKLNNGPGVDPTHYYDAAFISANIAYIVSSHNKLYKTTDGGQTWADVSPEPAQNFDGLGVTPRVSFINEDIGCVSFSLDDGSNNYNYDVVFGYVWCTRDGGQTWSQRFDINDDQIKHLQQVTENLVYVSGTARLGVTSTRWFKKITWDPQNEAYTVQSIAPLPTSRPHVNAADWLNQNVGVALGQLNVPPWNNEPFITRDGGATWSSIKGNLPSLDNAYPGVSDNSIHILNENTFLFMYYKMVDSQYVTSIWKTVDGGVSWTPAAFDVPAAWLFSFYINRDSNLGIAVGGDSAHACYITRDAGYTWQLQSLPGTSAQYYPYSAGIAGDGTSWIIGTNRSIWKTTKPPVADFRADIRRGVVPLTVQFTDNSRSEDVLITSWQWDFGDGNTGAVQNPLYTYENYGLYTVTLIVSNGIVSDTLVLENFIDALALGQAFINDVVDVPDDQGGWVTVAFQKSFYDTATPLGKTTSASGDTVEMYTVEINDGSGWMAANSMVAYGAESYEILAHTPLDSSVTGNGLLSFRIIAGMAEGTFISSDVQGYSVDNLKPHVPTGLLAQVAGDGSVQLDWDEPIDEDFQYFMVYRSMAADFDPSGMEPYVKLTENYFVDTETMPAGVYYYRIVSVDFHGNESNCSAAISATISAIYELTGIPTEFALKGNYPNPFNPTTNIPFDLPKSARVILRVYDYRGSLIRTLVSEIRNSGYHTAVWDARNDAGRGVASGVYVVRLQADQFSATNKILLMR
ncbi:MAG: PKD domain-containing protein [bacterium]